MVTDIELLDPNKKYTYADYLKWKFDEYVELIKGQIYKMSPAPSTNHQGISTQLVTFINYHLTESNCRVFHAPFDVRLFPEKDNSKNNTVVQPDLCVICDPSKIDEQGCLGAPDLIVEILSPSSSKRDSQDKFSLYEEAGVLEYWMVFPSEKIVQVFDLKKGKFALREMYSEADHIPAGIFPDLKIDLKKVFSS